MLPGIKLGEVFRENVRQIAGDIHQKRVEEEEVCGRHVFPAVLSPVDGLRVKAVEVAEQRIPVQIVSL
jgi:hypothetical protein